MNSNKEKSKMAKNLLTKMKRKHLFGSLKIISAMSEVDVPQAARLHSLDTPDPLLNTIASVSVLREHGLKNLCTKSSACWTSFLRRHLHLLLSHHRLKYPFRNYSWKVKNVDLPQKVLLGCSGGCTKVCRLVFLFPASQQVNNLLMSLDQW